MSRQGVPVQGPSGDTHSRPRIPTWVGALGVTLAAFFLYLFTLAPGLTWANFGADGGELIAAAVTNGVPHPPGYPLYMMLLRGWLTVGRLFFPAGDLAWMGNLLSALCAALSGGMTVLAVSHLLDRAASHLPENVIQSPDFRWIWSILVGVAWISAPLLWQQAIITEVYALHALLIAFFGWVLLTKEGKPLWLIAPVALGIAHHLTFVLLLPGALYWLWSTKRESTRHWFVDLVLAGLWLLPGVGLGLLFYLRIPFAAGSGSPINWGYPDNWDGFWWLTSAAAYRAYLFGVPATSVFDRIAAWAFQLTSQFTAIGLALALLGLSFWDREDPRLRNWGLLWLLPISIYAISYYTKDSTIYLLPCIWLLTTWLGVGLWWGTEWLCNARYIGTGYKQAAKAQKELAKPSDWLHSLTAPLLRFPTWVWPLLSGTALLILLLLRLPDISLRNDREAITFLEEVAANLPEKAIIISAGDAETFALWYGVWASGELLPTPDANADEQDADPMVDPRTAALAERAEIEPVLINSSLMQFDWYQRLLRERYHFLPAIEQPLADFLLANRATHTILLTEEGLIAPGARLRPVGPFWQVDIEP